VKWWLAPVLLFAGCAPTTLAPSILRAEPLNPSEPENRFGIRTGPRLGPSISKLKDGTLDEEVGTPIPPELGVALEYSRAQPLWRGLSAHLAVQCEVMYAIPFPGLSASGGLSYRWQFGPVSIAPALAGRAGTDFGISVATTPGSFFGGDFGVSISAAEGDVARLGITPFVSAWRSFDPRTRVLDTGFFPGAMLFARFRSYELLVGFGRMFVGGHSWNVPLIGVRYGGN